MLIDFFLVLTQRLAEDVWNGWKRVHLPPATPAAGVATGTQGPRTAEVSYIRNIHIFCLRLS